MIILKTPSQIDGIRKSCKIVAYVLKELYEAIKPGITTKYLNQMAEELCLERGGTPGFKGYRGFPYSICSSRNEEIVHGFPSDSPLVDGEILSVDFGVLYKGWYGDSAFTKAVGNVDKDVKRLLKTGQECLDLGIKAARPYARIGDISHAVQKHAEKRSYSVVREFVGHGIGRDLHEDPPIPNYGAGNSGSLIKKGMVIAIEPMVCAGHHKTCTLLDGWTTITADKKLAVHFEHTIAITESGTEVLTKRD